jgi:benzoylformate decarboxylase
LIRWPTAEKNTNVLYPVPRRRGIGRHSAISSPAGARAIGPDIVIVDEAIATSSHLRGLPRQRVSRQYSFLRAAICWGMRAAVGQTIGLDRQLIVCLVGNVPRCTRHRHSRQPHKKLPVTFVMMNNPEYNVLKSFMRSQ